MLLVETETKETNQDTPPGTGQSSEEKAVIPETYSKAEYLKAISEKEAALGRLKSANQERDTLKSQVEQLSNQVEEASSAVEETKAKITQLEEDIETLGDENAPAAEIAKIRKRLASTEEQLKKDWKSKQDATNAVKKALDQEREQWAGTVSEYQQGRQEIDAYEAAEEYDGDVFENKDRIKAVCDAIVEETGKPVSKETIKSIAARILTKKTVPAEEPPMIGDSGMTRGGGEDWHNLSAEEKIRQGLKEKK